MKKVLTIIICIAILNTSCTQSSTTPTVPPATTNPCGFTTNSNQYIELKINGLTLRSESILFNGADYFPVGCTFITSGVGRQCQFLGLTTTCTINSTMISNLGINLAADKQTNYADPLGVYGNGSANFSYFINIANKKDYRSDSLTVTVTNCTADYVSGTFVGTAKEINTNIVYPLTGIFNNLKRNGF